MFFTSENFLEQSEKLTGEAEKNTTAEVVVVIAGHSGSYEDINWRWTMVGVLLFIAFTVYFPADFDASWLLWEVICIAALFFYVSHGLSFMRRLLVGTERLQKQTREVANQAFTEESITATRERTGIMLYYSLFEEYLVIVPDIGVESVMPQAIINQLSNKVNSCRTVEQKEAAFFEIMKDLAKELPEYLPCKEGADNPNEIANVPRIRG